MVNTRTKLQLSPEQIIERQRCPSCGAIQHAQCVSQSGWQRRYPHKRRAVAAVGHARSIRG